ncbi:tetratricopeptide repeat protein, partial [Prosthecobacter sp.]|uniref:tetratricopeptide repeat protein n=1 Tax=Prosthecobacter sp. TaxID=1965333 RepID=UPI0024894083
MPESASSHIGFYRSGLTSPEHRRFVTVGRDHLIQDTLESLRKNAGRSTKHHALFIGLRGMGKTHLLSRIEDEIAADTTLAAHYHVVRFPEESLRTLSFADFLLGMVEILAATCPAETAWQTLLERLRGEEDDIKVVDTLVPAIRRSNEEHKRTLIIMLENMGEVFTRQMKNPREVAALRKFLMESKNHCLLLGTATMSFEGLTSVDEPFYDFFDIQHLDHLSEEDSTALVRRTLEWEKRDDLLAQWDTLYPRLIALYRMTGGSPRLTVMLASLIARDSVIEVRDQFRKLLDHITPFFQDRLNTIAPQERALLETMATMRDMDKTPASIAARMRKKVTHISTLLKRLTELRLLRSTIHPDDKRVRRYDISEGFFDLWLYMNVSRGARDRLPFLLDFFASFYPSYLEREKKRAELFTHSSTPEKQSNCLLALDTLSEVGLPPERARAKLFLASAYAKTGHAEDASQLLSEAIAQPIDRMGSWIVRSAAATPYPDYLTEIQELITLWDEHRTGNLEGFVRLMCEMGDTFEPHAYSLAKLQFLEVHLEEVPAGKERTRLRLQLGSLHQGLAHWQTAEVHLRYALLECESESDHLLLSTALNNLAHLLYVTNRLEEAEEPMRRALKLAEASYGPDHPTVAIHLNNLAQLLQATNRLEEVEEPMRRALKIDEASYGPDHPTVAIRLNNLALLLQDTNRLEEAEEPMRRALKIDEASYGPD